MALDYNQNLNLAIKFEKYYSYELKVIDLQCTKVQLLRISIFLNLR